MSKDKATQGISTLALIYGLEAGLIKQFQSEIQIRHLVHDLLTLGNENVCFCCDVETPSKQVLDLYEERIG